MVSVFIALEPIEFPECVYFDGVPCDVSAAIPCSQCPYFHIDCEEVKR